jgi:hypothetical protein
MQLPAELQFLEDYLTDPNDQYKKAEWLLSKFDSSTWEYSFDFVTPNSLSWDVELSDYSLLTDPKHCKLLQSLKCWLIASTLPTSGTGFSNGLTTQYRSFLTTLLLIDYLLINNDRFQLHRFGLAGLNSDDLRSILESLSRNARTEESLFNWSQRILDFSLDLLSKSYGEEIDEFLSRGTGHFHNNVSPDDEDEASSFGISREMIPRLRATLDLHGLMRVVKGGKVPNSIAISEQVFPRSLRVKHTNKQRLSFLCSFSEDFYIREYSSVPVTTDNDDVPAKTKTLKYQSALYSMGALHELGLPAPTIEDLVEVRKLDLPHELMGRYRTLPSSVVFEIFKDSVEFHFQFGRKVLDAYLRLAIYSVRNDCLISEVPKPVFDRAIGPELHELGVKYVSLMNYSRSQNNLSKEEYFKALRANQGLTELVLVYFGAAQLVAGSLSARRSGELVDLKIGFAIDRSGGWIVFHNRKSSRGLMGLRAQEARPLEPISVKMIQELERFQRVLNRIGYGPKCEYVFAPPNAKNSKQRAAKPSAYLFNRNFDILCDYFETDLNAEGKRYYIRQHQLRRFFALLFFYSRSFGGLETLQWMLGHTDLSHVWHYISESIGGDVLRSAKSQFVAESLHRNETETFKELAALVEARYGTDDFTLIDTEEMEDYIADLLEEGDIEIEPEFFEGPDGEDFKVVVKVKETAKVIG